MSNPATNMTNLRNAIRLNSSLNAGVYFDGTKLYDCVIKDISTSGMRLYIPRMAWLPTYFELTSDVFPDLIPVKRVWCDGDDVGVQIALK